MGLDDLEHADPLQQRPPAELVPDRQARLIELGHVGEQALWCNDSGSRRRLSWQDAPMTGDKHQRVIGLSAVLAQDPLGDHGG